MSIKHKQQLKSDMFLTYKNNKDWKESLAIK